MSSGGARFYDFEGSSTVAKGPRTRQDHEPWTRRPAKPEETPWLEWRDWGRRTIPQFQLWWEPDPALMAKFAKDWLAYIDVVPRTGLDVPLVIPEPPKTPAGGPMGMGLPPGIRPPGGGGPDR